ncbi:MAG: hypothetical protein HQL44_04430 [Alphaproteobacteria bacterium]|nr:hypothetical protein [Alphaproteobacteria bacterium]
MIAKWKMMECAKAGRKRHFSGKGGLFFTPKPHYTCREFSDLFHRSKEEAGK